MSGFDALALNRGYAYLDALPAALYVPVVTHSHGSLEARTRAVLRWRAALLQGELPTPDELGWPAATLRDALLGELRVLKVARFCKGQEELTDSLLLSVLQACERYEREVTVQVPARFAALRAQELAQREAAARATATKKGDGKQGSASGRALDQAGATLTAEQALSTDAKTLALLRAAAQKEVVAEQIPGAAAALRATWRERAAVWDQLAEVFGEIGQLIGAGWSLCRGLLASQGWLEIARLRALLEHIPALKALVRTLGRMQASEVPDEAPILERILGPLRRSEEERREVRSPLARSETRGIIRSDDLARMLPGEASLLGHKRLRMLWHARRAERTLLCYQVEGVLSERVPIEVEATAAQERPAPRQERGPILVCLDTSGSMAGHPEHVAKALALEALRVAHLERRACYIYAFSGPGEVTGHELSLTPEGLGRLLSFLTASFHGGTDVQAPLLAACARLQEPTYQRADLLLLSDGEFAVPPAVSDALREARQHRKLRVHGVVLGPQRSPAMASLCDPLHRFLDWNTLERGAGLPL